MKPLFRKILMVAAFLGLALGFNLILHSTQNSEVMAFPDGPGDVVLPPPSPIPPPEDDCWEEGPGGFEINTCLTLPTEPPETPGPGDDDDDDDNGEPELDPMAEEDENLPGGDNVDGDLGPIIDLNSEAGGCNLGNVSHGSMVTLLLGVLIAGLSALRMFRIRRKKD